MAMSYPRREVDVLISTSVDWNLTSVVTNVSMRKEVTVVPALETYSLEAMANVVNIKIFVSTIMADVVRYASFIIIIRDVRVEKDLKSIQMIKLNALISMSVALSISK